MRFRSIIRGAVFLADHLFLCFALAAAKAGSNCAGLRFKKQESVAMSIDTYEGDAN